MEDFNDWIKIINQTGFNTNAYNYLILDAKNLLFDISSNQVIRILKNTPIHLLVISHFHLDHQTGKERLKERFNTKIIAHELEAASIESMEGFNKNYNIENGIELVKELHLKFWRFHGAIVDGKVRDGDTIDLGEHQFMIIHTPGTSPGHISLFENRDRILFAGDMGPHERPVYNSIYSSVSDYLKSYDKIINLQPKIVLSAHYPAVFDNIAELYERAKQRVLKREEHILRIIESKKNPSLEEIVLENPTIKNKPTDPTILKWMNFAEKIQVLHHLEKLKSEHKIIIDENGRYRLIKR